MCYMYREVYFSRTTSLGQKDSPTDSLVKKKFLARQSVKKIMLANMKRSITTDFFEKGATLNISISNILYKIHLIHIYPDNYNYNLTLKLF